MTNVKEFISFHKRVMESIGYLITLKSYLALSFILFILAVIGGYASASLDQSLEDQVLNDFSEKVKNLENFLPSNPVLSLIALVLLIFANNLMVSVISILSGFIAPIPLTLVLINGYVVGVVVHSTPYPILSAITLLPHGVVEVPMILCAASLGTKIGIECLKWLFHRESALKSHLKQTSIVLFYFITPLLLLAAIIEVFISGTLLNVLSP